MTAFVVGIAGIAAAVAVVAVAVAVAVIPAKAGIHFDFALVPRLTSKNNSKREPGLRPDDDKGGQALSA
jgi:hypothetical protein